MLPYLSLAGSGRTQDNPTYNSDTTKREAFERLGGSRREGSLQDAREGRDITLPNWPQNPNPAP
jgi:hypothetical protein